MHKQPGYILFMTFSILALCAALVSAFLIKGMVHKRLTTVVLEREQLEQLALSLPAIAQSFLSFSAISCSFIQMRLVIPITIFRLIRLLLQRILFLSGISCHFMQFCAQFLTSLVEF